MNDSRTAVWRSDAYGEPRRSSDHAGRDEEKKDAGFVDRSVW